MGGVVFPVEVFTQAVFITFYDLAEKINKLYV